MVPIKHYDTISLFVDILVIDVVGSTPAGCAIVIDSSEEVP